jgi:hypothetical protein
VRLNTELLIGVAIAWAMASSGLSRVVRAADTDTRNFYEVLDDVLSDFEYDLKNGNVTGLKELAVRNVALSENVPPSFKSHLELLVTERILRASKTRVLQCLACRAKQATIKNGQVTVTSPEYDPAALTRIAKENGISHFLDIAFAYQPSGMILSLYITDPDSGAVTWTKTYNSESSRAAAFRRGVDYTQIDEARKQTEYVPTVQYRGLIYYLSEPNVGTRTGVLGFGFRAVERYDNRKKEVGFELDYLKDTAIAVPAGQQDLYNSFNVTMIFVHAWNFIGDEEVYSKPRGSLSVGIGGTYASGFLGAVGRVQYEWRLGRHFAVTPNLGYRPKATAFTSSTPTGNVSGAELGLGVGFLF